MSQQRHSYFDQKVVLATQHRKGEVIAPEFAAILGMQVNEFSVDTDSLGTFSGDVERIGTPKEVVIQKAKLGIEQSGYLFGLASEGSIGTDPFIPFINSDIELMAFIDVERDLTVVESLRSTEIIAAGTSVRKNSDIEDFLVRVDFPHHKLIIKSPEKTHSYIVKGIGDRATLDKSLAEAFKEFPEVIIESDLRAHCSPSRMANIAKLANKLALRLSEQCPGCNTPGWGVVDYERGLPCSECGEISEEAAKAEILGCFKCTFSQRGKVIAESINPSRCDLCNP